MAFDKNNPPGNKSISIGDNSIRDNNDGLETALTAEHEFATGAAQTGWHKFGIDTELNRDLISAFVNGSIFLANDVRTGRLVFQAKTGGSFENVDIEPMDAATGLIPTLPRLDSRSVFIACQFGTFASVTPVGGTPDTLAIDLSLSPAKYATISNDTIISNPTNQLSSSSTTVQLDLAMSGAGHVITFGTNYRTPSGAAPSIASTHASLTTLFITQLQSGGFLVSSSPGLVAIV